MHNGVSREHEDWPRSKPELAGAFGILKLNYLDKFVPPHDGGWRARRRITNRSHALLGGAEARLGIWLLCNDLSDA